MEQALGLHKMAFFVHHHDADGIFEAKGDQPGNGGRNDGFFVVHVVGSFDQLSKLLLVLDKVRYNGRWQGAGAGFEGGRSLELFLVGRIQGL